MKYVVSTRDVDGSTRRTFASFKGARGRFESMLGMTMEQAASDFFYEREVVPAPDAVTYLRGVSMFGTVVEFRRAE